MSVRSLRSVATVLGLAAACSEPPPVASFDATVDVGDSAGSEAGDDAGAVPCNRASVPVVDAPRCTPRVLGDDDMLPDVPASARCVPGRALACRCVDGAAGVVPCNYQGYPGPCFCDPRPALRPDGGAQPPPPHPPRLVAPLSGMRATSRRPTLRWVLPAGIARARVELCDDRPCARRVTQAEVNGTSWRPAELLRPGVVFWRVTGLRADGASAWTSATWEFGVRHLDTPTDSVSGPIRDVNGDDVEDVVLSYGTTSFIPGSREGLPLEITNLLYLPSLRGAGRTTIGDVDGDGIADLAFAFGAYFPEAVAPLARVYFGSAGCPFQRGIRVDPVVADDAVASPRDIAITDFDGDGYGDVAIVAPLEVALYRGQGGRLGVHDRMTIAAIRAERFAGVGDVDGDGYGDVIVEGRDRGADPTEMRVLYGNPRGLLDERVQSITTETYSVPLRNDLVDDFSGDGKADLFIDRGAMADIYWGSDTGLRSARTRIQIPGSPVTFSMGALFGDLDGDGRSEFYLRGTVVFSSYFSAQPPTPLYFPYDRGFRERSLEFGNGDVVGDVNGDGFDDLLAGAGMITNVPSGGRYGVVLHLGGARGVCAPARAWDGNQIYWSSTLSHF